MYGLNFTTNNNDGKKMSHYSCAAVFMLVASIIFFVAGIATISIAGYTLRVTQFGGHQIMQEYSLSTIYGLLVIGVVFAILTICAMYTSCNPIKALSKIVLALIAIFAALLTLIQCALILVGLDWLGVIYVNITEITGSDSIINFNNTVKYIESQCCTNTFDVGSDICDTLVRDCANYDDFYTDVVLLAGKYLEWVCVALGITALLEFVMSVTSCWLMCANKRVLAYYKPSPLEDHDTARDTL